MKWFKINKREFKKYVINKKLENLKFTIRPTAKYDDEFAGIKYIDIVLENEIENKELLDYKILLKLVIDVNRRIYLKNNMIRISGDGVIVCLQDVEQFDELIDLIKMKKLVSRL